MANTHALDFEATNSERGTVADSNSLDISGSFTIEAWVKLESYPANNVEMIICGKYKAASAFGAYQLGVFGNGTDAYVRGVYTNSAGVAKAIANGTTKYVTGTWIHIAITYNSAGGANSGKIYKNGTETESNTQDADTLETNTQPFYLGFGSGQAGDAYLDGIIDDVRIWNVVRSATEISDNYNKELVGNESGLVAYWKLNNNGNDETANANNLTSNTGTFVTDVPFVGGLSVSVNDTITITESITMLLISNLSVSDAITVSEAITMANTQLGGISVNDSITVSESLTLLSAYTVSVNDTIVIAESVTAENANLGGISVNEAVTITESRTMSITPPATNLVYMRSDEQSYPRPMDDTTIS